MNRSSSLSLSTALVAAAGLSLAPLSVPTAQAASSLFSEQSVNQSQFVVMAAPRNSVDYNLVVLEQKSNSRDCWTESNGIINPLLLNFDFSGICGRATDSNGYSVRMAGEDLGLKYSLRLVDRGDHVALLASPSRRNQAVLEIGRTKTAAKDYLAVELNPGWNLSRRVYDGKALGHIYFSNEMSLANTIAAEPAPVTRPVSVKPEIQPEIQPETKPAMPEPISSSSTPEVTTVGEPLPLPPAVPGAASPAVSIPILVEEEFAEEFAASEVPVIEEPVVVGAAGEAINLSDYEHYSSLNPLYQTFLGRDIDPAGLKTYGKKLDQGKSLDWVRDRLRNSREGKVVAINRLYREVLGREADADGLRAYGKRLAQGWTLSQVRSDLANSNEGRQRLANR